MPASREPVPRDEVLEQVRRGLAMVVRSCTVPRMHERIAGRAGVEIERVAAVALIRLSDREGMRLSEFARHLEVDLSTASRHVTHLEGRGLVARGADPADARAVCLTVTGEGRRLVARLRAAHREVLAEVLATWSSDDLGRLADLFEHLAADLSAAMESAPEIRT